ncbi:prominin-2 [Astyanax mexicanus]|uniref:prominin-2 n=1 Tax=Astyanax mexicanus TaxID=7994 RepID=UPI0020CAAB7F|nr:prominin-2 [Astyanax mexicanus]
MLHPSSRTVLILLGLTAVSSAALTQCPPDQVDPQYQVNLSHTSADSLPSSAGSLEPLYNFAQTFLQSVQPYGLPLDVASRLLHNEAASSEVLSYEAGYVVCLILAILYVVIIPVGGAVLAWQYFLSRNVTEASEPPSSLPWYQKNVTVITCLSVTVILLLSGVILTFTTNNRMHQNMEPNLSHIRANLGDIQEALSSVPRKVQFIVDQFSYFYQEMTTELTGTGALIGNAILSSLHHDLAMTFRRQDITVQDATGAQRHLQEVMELRRNMQDTYGFLQTELEQMQSRLNNLNISLNTANLDTDANYNLIPSVNAEVQGLGFVPELQAKVQQAKTSIKSIPEVCEDQITPKIKAWLVKLNQTQDGFKNYSKRLPSLSSLSDTISDMRASLDEFKADLQYYDYVRWSVSAIFCILLLIVSLLMLAGLVIGASVVISPTLYPFHLQDQLRLTAVYLLYISIGMMLVFSWLFIIMVFINLLIGGNAHALVCRSISTGEIFQYMDKQDYLFISLDAQDPDVSSTQSPTASTTKGTTALFPNVTNGTSYQVTDHQWKPNISSSKIMEGCATGISLFYTMKIDKIFNMDQFLNASIFLTGFSNSMMSLNINLNDILLKLLNTQATVQQFKYSSYLDQIKYNDFRVLLATPVVKTDLDTFAGELEIAAQSANDTIREKLISEAANARQLATKVRLQDSYRLNMSSSINALENISKNYKTNADNTLLSMSETENALQLEVPHIVQDVSGCMMEKGENLLTQYLDVVRYVIIDQALSCLWLPPSLDNLYTATCRNLIGPWNGFWLSLGWCCAFLIPGVVFSIFAARLWKPSLATNKEPFHMPKAIIDKSTQDKYLTMDYMTGKRKGEDTMKNNCLVYWTLDDVMKDSNKDFKGKEEKGVTNT